MRKAQTELFGLVIVFIIISIALVFYIQLSGPEKRTPDSSDTKLASNTLSVLLRTTHSGLKLQARSLWQACAESRTVAGQDPCEKALGLSNSVFGKTLEVWERDYYFSVQGGAADEQAGSLCPGEKQAEIFYLPSDQGPIVVTLEICR